MAKSIARLKMRFTGRIQLFHTPGGHDSQGYATVPVNDHFETWPVQSNGFRRWLGRQFYDEFNKTPGGQAIQDALNVIAGKAVYDGAEHAVAVRLAQYGQSIYLDLVNAEWQVVEITCDRWRVVSECPVKFVRAKGMGALPIPVVGGDINELREFINVANEDDWALLISWIVAALCPQGPYPVLPLSGEQGSAKSTTSRVLRALIDPNIAPLRSEPREPRDLMIAAKNGWMIAFDNLSHIPPWLSDALCRLATGGGFPTRELYSDDSEKIFNSMRPVLLNGIEELATRPDLLDRSIPKNLPTIPEDKRRSEAELWKAFNEAHPRILGALLDAVSVAIRNRPLVHLAALPRMADFAIWATAAEPALGLAPGAFMRAYTENRESSVDLAIESSAIGPALLEFMTDVQSGDGTAGELLEKLTARQYPNERAQKRRDWPGTPKLSAVHCGGSLPSCGGGSLLSCCQMRKVDKVRNASALSD